MGVCPRLEFDDITLIYADILPWVFIVRLSVYAIRLLIYDVMYDISTTPKGTGYDHFYSNWHIM